MSTVKIHRVQNYNALDPFYWCVITILPIGGTVVVYIWNETHGSIKLTGSVFAVYSLNR